MAQDPSDIVAVAAMIRPQNGEPYCVVRWTLGASGSELPHRDDVFEVSLSVGGVIVAQTSVSPKNYAMLDPSRREAYDLYPNDPQPWWVATKPSRPVDPADADLEDLRGKPIGVVHLLQPTAVPRLRFRAARTLFRAFEAVAQDEPRLATLTALDLTRSALSFADILIRSRVRPRHLPRLLAREYRQMQAGAADPKLLQSDRRGLAQLAHEALVLRALSIPGVPERLEEVVEQSNNVREHIRVAGLQGGAMVDYWDDPENSGVPHDDANRGKLWPAAELIGCGCRIPVALADLQTWARGTDTLKVTVAHRPRAVVPVDLRSLAADRFQTLGDIWLAEDRTSWGSVTSEELVPGRLRLALSRARSSHPARPPKSARVDWGMVRVELKPIVDLDTQKTVPTGASLFFRTGDAKIEICIERPPPPPPPVRTHRKDAEATASGDERTGAAYNIYGVWEGVPGFQSYFDDPTLNPDLAILRPWLLTRRYSFAKDFKEAFPKLGGAEHPSLNSLVENPPWHPLLKRPNQLHSETHPDVSAVPDVGGPGDAVFSFDLRTGMAPPATARPPKGWDPSAPMAIAWRPDLDRELVPVQGGLRPQRYRFWVTAVDAFEQESEPCPVFTHDEDLEEPASTIFEPRRRSALGAPPGGDALTCVFDTGSKQLTVSFETPFERQVSDQAGSGAPTVRVHASTIEARVVLFRRLLLAQPNSEVSFRTAGQPVPDLPQWLTLAEELAGDRWQVWNVATVASPTTGDQWSSTVTLGEDDLGWEYLAAVGVQVKAVYRGFWAKPVVSGGAGGRRLTLISPDENGHYPPPENQPVVRITETPADSEISTAKPCMVGDAKEPWWPDVTAFRIARAIPITAPPGVRRDYILQCLLERSFSDNGQTAPKVRWGEEDLTVGQAKMSEAALERTRANDGALPPVLSEALAPARRILARDFRLDPGGRLRQHASIGFRGLACLEWTYTPRSKRNSAVKRAEAAAFRVYSAMAPEDDQTSRSFATLIGTISRVGTSGLIYAVAVSKGDDDAWATIGARPTLVAVHAGGQPLWASVVRLLSVNGAHQLELRKDGGGSLPPGPIEARFFAAQPLEDVPSGGVDDVSLHQFYAPIPGGGGAWFAWWVTGVSAAGAETPPNLIGPMHRDYLPRTVEPPPVHGLNVRPGVKSGDVMNPAQYRDWMPRAVQTVADANHFPRTVLTWRAPGESLFLEIRRIEEQIARPTTRLVATSRTAWDAILAIEALADGQAIDRRDLDALRDWLMGQPVQSPDAVTDYWTVFPPGSGLSADGVIQIDHTALFAPQSLPAADDLRPAWVDYFGRNGDRVSAMDANWHFKYQLCTYVDLGPSAGAQRWLYSTPTPWSPFVVPDRPPIKVQKVSLTPVTTQRMKARVAFTLKALLTSRLRMERLAVDGVSWEYRVVVRRLLPSAGISDNDPPWIDVGEPVRLLIGDPNRSVALVYDDEVDRSWPGHRPELIYRIFVQEFMETHLTDTVEPRAVERLVRAYETSEAEDVCIELEAPMSEADEIEMRQVIEIS